MVSGRKLAHYPAQGSTGTVLEPPRCTWRLATLVYLLRDIPNAAVKVPREIQTPCWSFSTVGWTWPAPVLG